MNDLQFDALIEKVVKKISAELANKEIITASPAETVHSKRAYVVMPEKACPAVVEKATDCLEKLGRAYETTIVVPHKDFCNLALEKLEADHIIKDYREKPQGEYVVVFVSASRNLIAKTALCLSDCPESRIAIDAIESGQSVYMYKEENGMCASAPQAYKRRVAEYERQLAFYGVSFNELPKECFCSSTDNHRAGTEERRKSIITAADVKQINAGEKLFVYPGDIFTDIAEETAKSRKIEVVYC